MQKPVLKLLLVDDDEEALILLKGCISEIKSTRFLVDWVPSIEAARKIIVEKVFDVFLVDYFLGKEEGSTLLRELKELGITTPVVMLTGMAVPAADKECMELGAAAFLNKDYLFADILERTIRYALQRRKIEELQSKKAALDERCKLLSELSQKMEPDIKQVLNLSDSIAKTNLDNEQKELVHSLIEAAHHLSDTAHQAEIIRSPEVQAA